MNNNNNNNLVTIERKWSGKTWRDIIYYATNSHRQSIRINEWVDEWMNGWMNKQSGYRYYIVHVLFIIEKFEWLFSIINVIFGKKIRERERERKNWWNDMFQFMFNEEETKLNNQQQQWVQQDQQQLK